MKFKYLLALGFICNFSITVSAFDAGEHALLGNIAFDKVNSGYPNNIKNLEINVSYSYGQLVAMSADMYKSVEEISLSDASILNGFYKRNRKNLKKCVDKEIEAIRTGKVYAGCDDIEYAKRKLRYVTLAHDNYSHFAWHNIKNYIEHHSKALWFAQLAYLKCNSEDWKTNKKDCELKNEKLIEKVDNSEYEDKLKSKYRKFPKLFPRKKLSKRYLKNIDKEKLIQLALFSNAFADHYLTDAFSAGHLRIPRSQIDGFVENNDSDNNVDKKENNKKNTRNNGSSISGALTQYLHNLDGSLTGIPVVNSLGKNFLIRGDKEIFSLKNSNELSGQVENNQQIQQPVIATSISINEVFNVIKRGNIAMPTGNYEALKYVPFIENSQENSLAHSVDQHIKEHGSIKNAIKSMSKEMQVVFKSYMLFSDDSYKDYFKQFIVKIPGMMEKLRAQIRDEITKKRFQKRIPKALKQALENIN